MSEQIKIITIIVLLAVSGGFFYFGLQSGLLKDSSTESLVAIDNLFRENKACVNSYSEACVIEQTFKGKVANSKLVVNRSSFDLESNPSNDDRLGLLDGKNSFRVFSWTEEQGERGLYLTSVPSFLESSTNAEICVEGRYLFFKQLEAPITNQLFEFSEDTGFIELFPCLEEQDKLDLVTDLKFFFLDRATTGTE